MKIGELSKSCGLTAHTIRYYERIGLLPKPHKDTSGHRTYEDSILIWVAFLERLKTTNMPIREMQRYADLRAQGEHTNAQRKAMLIAHRKQVQTNIDMQQAALSVLDKKIATYSKALKGQTHDDSR